MNPPPDEIRQRLINLHNALGQSDSADCLNLLPELMAEHGLMWGDWPELFCWWGFKSTTAPQKVCRTIRGLHAQMGRASTVSQQQTARNLLIKRLAESSQDWTTDLPGILGAEWHEAHPQPSSAPSAPSPGVDDNHDSVNVFDVMAVMIEDYVVTTEAQRTVGALYCIFTHLYTEAAFTVAPHLGFIALGSSRGKSTFRKILQAMAHDGWHAHRFTVPGLRRKIVERLELNDGRTAPAIDEAENHGFLQGMDMLGLLDSLFESDGMVTIAGPDGKPLDYPAQAPVLWTMRGSLSDVPLALRSRSIIFEMRKGKPRARLPRHYMEEPGLVYGRSRGEAYFAAVRSGAIVLDPDPEMPPELCRDPRLEDMCRPC